MKEYRQYKVGDRVIHMSMVETGVVTKVTPSNVAGSNAYMVQYADGHESSAMDWQLAAPEDVVYSVVVNNHNDDGSSYLNCDTVTKNIEHAKERVSQLADQWRDIVGKYAEYYETEQDDLSFSAWKDGYYNDDHYVVVINANRLE